MSRITATILTSSLGMRHHLPLASLSEEFTDDVAKFLEAPLPQIPEEVCEEMLQFLCILMDRDGVTPHGIDHFSSERWDARWHGNGNGNRRMLLPGGWSATVEELVEAASKTRGRYRPSPDRAKPQQLLLPFWGGEMSGSTEIMRNVRRTPEGNRSILNTMLHLSNGAYFDPLDCDDCCFDMRQSSEDTDLLLFGIVAWH